MFCASIKVKEIECNSSATQLCCGRLFKTHKTQLELVSLPLLHPDLPKPTCRLRTACHLMPPGRSALLAGSR